MTTRRVTGSGVLVLTALLIAAGALAAAALTGPSTSVGTEERARDIAAGLHCPVCTDLSAADSPAPLARQMRQQIRQQLAAGETADEIRQGFVSAYGPSVLMSPPNHGWGRAVNLAPLAVLAGAILLGGVIARRGLRSRETAGGEDRTPVLAPEGLERVEQALAKLRREEP